MKKLLLIISIFFTLNMFSANPATENKKEIKLCVVDKETKEKLSGVTIIHNGIKKYTNLNGDIYLTVYKEKEVTVDFISYQKKNISLSDTTTIISLVKI